MPPSKATLPPSSTTTRLQIRSMAEGSCETSTTVVPAAIRSEIRAMHLRWNDSSPTARISSMSITSASRWATIANPSRSCIPDEYALTGTSMNSPSSEKSMIACARCSISSRPKPCSAPLR